MRSHIGSPCRVRTGRCLRAESSGNRSLVLCGRFGGSVLVAAVFGISILAYSETQAAIIGTIDGRITSVLADISPTPGDSVSESPAVDFMAFDSSISASETGAGASADAWAEQQSDVTSRTLTATGRAEKLVTVEFGAGLTAGAAAESIVDLSFEISEAATYNFSAYVFATKNPPVQGRHRSNASVLLERIGTGLLFAIYADAVDGTVDISDEIDPVDVLLPAGAYRLQAVASANQNGSSQAGTRPAWSEFRLRLAEVPEPSTLGLGAAGSVVLWLVRRPGRTV